jgi:hypothetical protein
MGSEHDGRARRKDGTQFPVEVSLSPLDTETGSPIIAVVRDVSAQRERLLAGDRCSPHSWKASSTSPPPRLTARRLAEHLARHPVGRRI